jgi:hypothetical protein
LEQSKQTEEEEEEEEEEQWVKDSQVGCQQARRYKGLKRRC